MQEGKGRHAGKDEQTTKYSAQSVQPFANFTSKNYRIPGSNQCGTANADDWSLDIVLINKHIVHVDKCEKFFF